MDSYTLAPEEATPTPPRRAPWGFADMSKAIGIVISLTFAIAIPSALVAGAIAGSRDVEDDPTALTIVLALSVVLEALMLWTAFRFSVKKYHLSIDALGLKKPARGNWMLPFGLVIGSLIIMYVYFGVLAALGIEPDANLPKGVFDNIGPFVVIFVLSVVVAPFVEEIFFRGFIFGGLRDRWGPLLGALGSGLLFGLAHVGNPGTIYILPPIAAVGALFAVGYIYTGSIIPGMIAHLLFNLLQVTVGLAAS